MNLVKVKINIYLIIIAVLILINFLLIYKSLNCYKSSKLNTEINTESVRDFFNAEEIDILKTKFEEKLILVVIINENSCNFCNNFVLNHLNNFTKKYYNNALLIINGSKSFTESILTDFPSINYSNYDNKINNNRGSDPICILTNNEGDVIIAHKAKLEKIEEISSFFKKISYVFESIK